MRTVEEIIDLIDEFKEDIREKQAELKKYRMEIRGLSEEKIDKEYIQYVREEIIQLRSKIYILEWVLNQKVLAQN